jgi:multidrug efflux pump subunit AcrA (membrane-fusion protein)
VLVPNEQMRIVAAPVGGMIEMLAVAPGSRVKRGQLVARLASPQALELQRDALQAGSQSALLQQSLKRDEQLFAEGLIAESRLQATRAAAAQAGAQASERRQGLALAGIAPGKLGGPLALLAPSMAWCSTSRCNSASASNRRHRSTASPNCRRCGWKSRPRWPWPPACVKAWRSGWPAPT